MSMPTNRSWGGACLLLVAIALGAAAPSGAAGRLGVLIDAVSEEFADANHLVGDERGLRVLEVVANGPAAKAGFAVDDILLELVEPAPARRLSATADLTSVLGGLQPGNRIVLRILRIRSGKREIRLLPAVLE
jgi:S1-C subfamily serine protease